MSPKTRYVPQRLRVLLSCEGSSERSYGRWLQTISERRGLHIHINSWIGGKGGGDFLSLVEAAVTHAKMERRGKRPYDVKGLLLDVTQKGRNGIRDQKAYHLAEEDSLKLIWQDPDHEAFLLRHLPGCETLHPAVGMTLRELIKHWPEYDKGMPALNLIKRIDSGSLDQILTVEQDLRIFLELCGFNSE